MDTATVGRATRAALAHAPTTGLIDESPLDPGDIPRSFVLTGDGVVHLSEASPKTLRFRALNPAGRS